MLAVSRKKLGAALLGVTLAISTTAPAVAVDPSYPPEPDVLSCNLTANKNLSRLKVNVNPNLRKGNYTFQLFKLRKDGETWKSKGRYRTRGRAEKRVLNRRAGTYYIFCYGKNGYLGAASSTVTLRK